MLSAQWWTVIGSAVWTIGGAIQAYREMAVFDRFYAGVLATHRGIVSETTHALVSRTSLWQFWRRAAIRRAVKREGLQLLTDHEKALARDIDLRALGWAVVCTGGAFTTAAAAATAITP